VKCCYWLTLVGVTLSIFDNSALASVDGGAMPLHQYSTHHNAPWSLSLGVETVLSQVDHEPHVSGGGFAPVEKQQRFQSNRLGLRWSPGKRFEFKADLASRTIVSKRDQYQLDSFQFSLRYTLPKSIHPWRFALSASIGTNRTSNLTKTSFTDYDEYLVTRANLNNPNDLQLQSNLFALRPLAYDIDSVAYIGLGQAITENNGFDGIVQDRDNCQYDFALTNKTSAVTLLEPCGSIKSFKQEFQSLDAFQEKYNFDASADFSGRTRYWQLGGQLSKRYTLGSYGVGYHYQRFFRGQIDDRLAARGGEPLLENHTLSAWWHHRINVFWQLEAGAQYSLHPMLNRLFVLYTGFTSERFQQDAMVFNLTLRYLFLR
jgi:hypothetical protein